MKKTQKIIILIAVLMAPIAVFLFLKKFGSNQFELPVYYIEGNPIAQCPNSSGVQHKVKSAFIDDGTVTLPAVFVLAGQEENEFNSDIDNVLAKYPSIKVWEILNTDKAEINSMLYSLSLDEETYINFINCELALGEDRWINDGIAFKYVLVDEDARIRGYIECNTMKEIDRLDAELDILINY